MNANHRLGLPAVLFVLLLILACPFIMSCSGDNSGDDDDDPDPDDDDDTVDDDDDHADDDDDDTGEPEPIDMVDLFIGTDGIGYGAAHLHPGPQMPNGMVRPGPDTSTGTLFYIPSFQHYGGYWYQDSHVRGFSQNRMVGTGDSDYGNVRLMPVLEISENIVQDSGYLASMLKESELAEVGRYSVLLENTGVLAEVTSANWSSMYRFSYPDQIGEPYVVVDVCGSIRPHDVQQAEVQVDAENATIYGSLFQVGEFSSEYGGIDIYFVIEFSHTFSDYGTFTGQELQAQGAVAAGDDIGAYAGFDIPDKRILTAKIGLSHISVAQARANLDEEISDFDFDAAVENNRDAWRDILGLIDIRGGTPVQRRIFYSALYRSFMMPTLFTEQGGMYIGFDDLVHTAEGFTYYTDMSLWDTFRTLHPLITFIDPDRSRDFIVSLITMSEQGGYLPRWPQGKGYTSDMIGTHADAVIADAYLKGITDIDAQTAYDGMFLHATQWVPEAGRSDIDNYLDLGWCATDSTGAAVSKTLEFAFDDHCIAQVAESLGYDDDAAMFGERAKNYVNLWDPDTQFMRGRKTNGDWHQPFIPWFPWADEYTQGNARHWMWFAPHDVPGLISLFGRADAMVERLDEFFLLSMDQTADALPNLYYWHGNQHDLQAAYMFNEAGRPDLTQKWSRHILTTDYSEAPDGLAGNEDGGTLMAWYVFSAMGLFPLDPCNTRYQLGSPLFDEITLHLPGGDFEIYAENNSDVNNYIQSATLNGEPLEVPWLEHSQIAGGGTLVLTMGPEPSSWGRP